MENRKTPYRKNTHTYKIEKNCLSRFKARLIVQGFKQQAWDSYIPDEISSPVMAASSLNMMLGVAAALDLELDSVDIKNAFITAELDQKIWVKLPSFCKVVDGKVVLDDNIALLTKGLYGTKQGSKCFFEKLKKFLIDFGFNQSKQDSCIFTYTEENGHTCMIGTHVDDLLVASTKGFFEILTKALNDYFPDGIKTQTADQFLGCRIIRDREKGEIRLSQKERIDNLKEMFKIEDIYDTILPEGKKRTEIFELESLALTEEDQQKTLDEVNSNDKLPNFESYSEVKSYYRSYTGNLVFLCCYGRPDIQSTVYRLARYQESPSIKHIMAVRHVIGYLVYSREKELIFGRQKMDEILVTHTDSSYADCPATGRSSGGYIHYLFGNYLSSRSFKINCVTRSVTAAEFYVMSAAAADSIYFRNLYNETVRPVMNNVLVKSDIVGEQVKGEWKEVKTVSLTHSGLELGNEILLSKECNPYMWMNEVDTVVYCDNSSAILQAKTGSNKRSKHIRIHNSYIWEQMHIFGNIRVGKIDTKLNSADLQTKLLKTELFDKHSKTIMGHNTIFNANVAISYYNTI